MRKLTEQQAAQIEAEMRALEADPATTVQAMRVFMQVPMPCGHATGNLLTCDSPPFGCVECNAVARAEVELAEIERYLDEYELSQGYAYAPVGERNLLARIQYALQGPSVAEMEVKTRSEHWPFEYASKTPHSCGGVVRYYVLNDIHDDRRYRCDKCGAQWVEEGPDA